MPPPCQPGLGPPLPVPGAVAAAAGSECLSERLCQQNWPLCVLEVAEMRKQQAAAQSPLGGNAVTLGALHQTPQEPPSWGPRPWTLLGGVSQGRGRRGVRAAATVSGSWGERENARERNQEMN